MAEPTLKDVLNAIARLERGQTEIRSEMATKGDLAKLEAKVEKRFDRVDKALEALDEDLDKHMKVHKELEKDVEHLKGRPPRTAARVARRPRTR
jgi:chromosome segregation ATPase